MENVIAFGLHYSDFVEDRLRLSSANKSELLFAIAFGLHYLCRKELVMAQQRRYPLGVQHFPSLREEGYVYVDKTEQVFRLTHLDSKYVFLSRPRRFGKSLLTSTLCAYFQGRKELFKGLAIEQLETDWTEHPVLQFDMSQGQHLDKAGLEEYIFDILKDNEERLGIEGEGSMTNIRLKNLIQKAYRKTGKRVVVNMTHLF